MVQHVGQQFQPQNCLLHLLKGAWAAGAMVRHAKSCIDDSQNMSILPWPQYM